MSNESSLVVRRFVNVVATCGTCDERIGAETDSLTVTAAIAAFVGQGWNITRHRDKTATIECPACIAKAADAKAERERALGLARAQVQQAQERLEALRAEPPAETTGAPDAEG